MAELYTQFEEKEMYYDRHSGLSREEYKQKLETSTTLYIGNLSFYSTEGQLLELFERCGEVKNLIMGLNRKKSGPKGRTPCGFCFVEYYDRSDAALAIDCLNRAILDGKQIRIDWDYGFKEGRQYGRGKNGGQVRDEVRYDRDGMPSRPNYKPRYRPY